MKILVTGGAGFIGSNVVDMYISEGHDVIVVDDLSSGKRENVNPKAKFYEVDIRSKEISSILQTERPDVVNHHAAQKSVPKSVEDPLHDADINIMGFLNLLEESVKSGVKKVISISSGGALAGDAKVIPTDETCEPIMISPYAITKYLSEKYLHFYNVTYGLKYTVLRYANVYGPRQIPDGECGVIPIFMENLLRNQPSTLYAYSDMPKGCTRDYVHVEDCARANVAALTRGDNKILNIGSEEELYISGIYDVIRTVIGKDLPLVQEGERTGDVRRSALDCTRAKEALGWSAQISLAEGIKKTVDFVRQKIEMAHCQPLK